MQNEEPTGFFFFFWSWTCVTLSPKKASHYDLSPQKNTWRWLFFLSLLIWVSKLAIINRFEHTQKFSISATCNEAISSCLLCLHKSKRLAETENCVCVFSILTLYGIKVRMGIKRKSYILWHLFLLQALFCVFYRYLFNFMSNLAQKYN